MMMEQMSWRARYLSQAETAEGATWECAACGVILPKRMNLFGIVRYARALCPCAATARANREYAEQKAAWQDQKIHRTYSWLGERWSDLALQHKTFANFITSYQPQAVADARDFCYLVEGSLVLHGSYGTGKTHLLAAVCNELLETRNMPSLFTSAPNLFAAIAECMQYNQSYSTLIEQAINAPFLVIDDIDKSKPTQFREDMYFAIIDGRTKNGRPTAISTNRLDELDAFVGGAVCSRLRIGQIASEMTGLDLRGVL